MIARRDRTVAVVGPGQPDDESLLTIAHEVGAGLAQAACTVVTGGLGGVMAAASRGARDEGGLGVCAVTGFIAGRTAARSAGRAAASAPAAAVRS